MNSLDYLTPPDSQLWPAAAWELDWARLLGAGPYKDSPHYPSCAHHLGSAAARSVLYPGIPGLISDHWFSALLVFKADWLQQPPVSSPYSDQRNVGKEDFIVFHHIFQRLILCFQKDILWNEIATKSAVSTQLIHCSVTQWSIIFHFQLDSRMSTIKQINVNISGPRANLGVNWSDTFAEILHSRVSSSSHRIVRPDGAFKHQANYVLVVHFIMAD